MTGMIEQAVYDYLKSKIAEIPVLMEVPENMPDEFVTVEKTNSSTHNDFVRSATFAIQSWSKNSKLNAAQISRHVCKVMDKAADDADEYGILKSSGGDYDFTDITTKRYRYQAVYTVIYM